MRTETIVDYFESDHRARIWNYLISSGLGASVLLGLEWLGKPEQFATWTSVAAIALSYTAFLLVYQARPAKSLVRAKARRLNQTPSSSSPTRRLFVFELSMAGLLLMFAQWLPKKSVAQEVNLRLMKLISQRRFSEASAVAQEAVKTGVPLNADVVAEIAKSSVPFQTVPSYVTAVKPPPDLLAPTSALPTEAISRIAKRAAEPVKVSDAVQLRVSQPVLFLHPDGIYKFERPMDAFGLSFMGTGPGQSEFVLFFNGEQGQPALISFGADRSDDAIIERINFSASSLYLRSGASAISVEPTPHRTVAAFVGLERLTQKLDGIIWEKVTFKNCTVRIEGRGFQLTSVQFIGCDFEFLAKDIPSEMKQALQFGDLQDKTIRYNLEGH